MNNLSRTLAQVEDDLAIDSADEIIGPDVRPPRRAILLHRHNLWQELEIQ